MAGGFGSLRLVSETPSKGSLKLYRSMGLGLRSRFEGKRSCRPCLATRRFPRRSEEGVPAKACGSQDKTQRVRIAWLAANILPEGSLLERILWNIFSLRPLFRGTKEARHGEVASTAGLSVDHVGLDASFSGHMCEHERRIDSKMERDTQADSESANLSWCSSSEVLRAQNLPESQRTCSG